MSPWNDDALVSLKESLKLNVLMNTGLADKLEIAAGGFLSRAEAQMVTALSNNSDQIDKVIEALRGKADEDFDTFCAMLRDSNNGIWADQLKREAQLRRGGRGMYTGERNNPVLTVYCGLWCHLHALTLF